MRLACILLHLLVVTPMLRAAAADYPRELARWQEIAVPSKSDSGSRQVWFFAANRSLHEWRVFFQGGQPQVQLTSEAPAARTGRPKFTPRAGPLGLAPNVVEVADGWLVGFNQGEFGAALYWFGRDGKASYKISDHQVVNFFPRADGSVDAAEGLSHLGLSRGSVIQVERPAGNARWQADAVRSLPSAPCTGVRCRDGSLLLVLSEALVRVDAGHNMTTLLQDVPWAGLYPNSAVLSSDERRLFIGMRQFVGEFDLTTHQLRLLVPAKAFLNRLPKEEELLIRKQYGG